MAVQSGNDEVLKRMNRRHSASDFIELVNRILAVKPQLELGTDIIVGFPGETEEQFMDTVRLFEKVKFKVAFISIYSPRKGTPSAKLYKDDVPFDVKKERHARLTKVWKESLK
jgi:tRNA-2-methylthio-N6-dimethylallyladenosine synthase